MLFESSKLCNLFGNGRASLEATAPLSLAPVTGWRESKWSEPEITKVSSELLTKSIAVSVVSLQRDNLASGPVAHVVSLRRQWPRKPFFYRELASFLKDDLIQENNRDWFSDWRFSGPFLPLEYSVESCGLALHSILVRVIEGNAKGLSSRIPNRLRYVNNSPLCTDQLLPQQSGLLLNLAISVVHRAELFIGDVGIDSSGDKGSKSGQKSSNLQHNLPPWRFVVAALAGIFGVAWGWWQLRRNERESVWIVLVFVGGFCAWGYAVYGLLRWGIDY